MVKNYYECVESLISAIPDLKENDCVVYTACFGGYDKIADPNVINNNFVYVCFTDDLTLQSNCWNVVYLEEKGFNPRLMARAIKMLPHKLFSQCRYSVWVDSKCLIVNSFEEILNWLIRSDVIFACFPHPKRSTVFSECIACIKIGHDRIAKILGQYFRYKLNGFPDNSQLLDSMILIRQHMKSDVVRFQELWFNEIIEGSIRDQLSFNYLAWLTDFRYVMVTRYKLTDIVELKPHLKYGVYKTNGFGVPFQRKCYNLIKSLRNR